ncbi:MAG: hypothetical protein QM715_01075 [Nibricoccus sp.]
MKIRLRQLLLFGTFLPIWAWADKYQPPKPIVTPKELAAAAAEVPVKRLDLTLPEVKDPMDSDALSDFFFNRPELQKFHGMITENWRGKWDILSGALVATAKKQKLESAGLARCLAKLNYGQNAQTRLRAFYVPPVSAIDKSQKEIDDERIAGEKQATIEEEELKRNPRYDETLASVPIAAYLAKYPKGECWIIVCAWEYAPTAPQTQQCMGHIRVWAMDAKTAEVIAYESCG